MNKKGKGKSKSGLGRALINDRFGKSNTGKRAKDPSILHSSEIPDGYDWGRLNLQSVTEESSFQEFLSTAQLAGTEFQAEKLNITFVNPLTGVGVLTKQEKDQVDESQKENKHILSIPRRPKWDESTTPEQLTAAENEQFLEWRRRLAILQEEKNLVLTPYEKNLEFWRQLWRVVERSDIIVQIVDARNPLLFRCEDLEKYVSEVSPHKQNLILLNKADYLTDAQRIVWANYFGELGVLVAFYSATRALEEEEEVESGNEEEVESGNEEEEEEVESGNEEEEVESGNEEQEGVEKGKKESEEVEEEELINEVKCNSHLEDAVGNIQIYANAIECKKNENKSKIPGDHDEQIQKYEELSQNKSDENEENYGDKRSTGSESNPELKGETSRINTSVRNVHNSHKLLNRSELISLFRNMHVGVKVTSGTTTVGLVGYPNVGKSSTINSLLMEKKVSVSATPGKTKHFQTHFLDKDLLLCDCPGLVMPSFVYSKAEMIINGILPIDQMRDHVPPISLVTSVIPRHVLEDTYGIMIPPPREGEDPDRPPTSEELLNAYGYNRGFMTQNGQPDNPRSSRYVLKDFVTGKLLYCHAPPSYSQEEFHVFPERRKQLGIKLSGMKTSQNHSSSELDQNFFKKSSSTAHSKGLKPGSAVMKPQAANGEKPWRDHSAKRNKREKLRRIYSYLDK